MTQTLALTAAGSVLIAACVYLLLLRLEVAGRRPVLALTRRWVAASDRRSALVLAALMAGAISAFGLVSVGGPNSTVHHSGEISDDQPLHPAVEHSEDLAALRAYADGLDGASPAPPALSVAREMPGVEQMIDNLVQRLQREPGDVRGWKMLGWSYLNTGRADEAAKAYETALKLAPADNDIAAALESARAAQRPTAETGASSR